MKYNEKIAKLVNQIKIFRETICEITLELNEIDRESIWVLIQDLIGLNIFIVEWMKDNSKKGL